MFAVVGLSALKQIAHFVQLVLQLLVLVEDHTELALQHLVLTAGRDSVFRQILELENKIKVENKIKNNYQGKICSL